MVNALKLQMFLQGIRQVDVAREAGCNSTYVSRVVNGKQKPSDKLVAAFRKLGLEVGRKS